MNPFRLRRMLNILLTALLVAWTGKVSAREARKET
jgi:hypothetical protein